MKVVGEPDDSASYMTGKIFIPFYFGTGAFRTDWLYEGQGRIVFYGPELGIANTPLSTE